MILLLKTASLGVAGLAAGWALLPLGVRLDPEVAPSLPVDAGLQIREYGREGTFALHYRHHDLVTLSVPVDNGGPLPITIDAADLDDGPLPLLVPVEDNLPVEVGAWGAEVVELTFRFDNCRYYHERSAVTWDRVDVEGSVLGRGFNRELELEYPIALHGQVIRNCPDRTLVRGDDVRPH